MSEVDAIHRCLAGDRAAYAVVVRAHGDPLVGVLCRLVGNLDDARDLAQETFVRAYRKLHLYDQRRPFKPWLYRIGRNLALNHLTARRRRPEGQALATGEKVISAMASETKSPLAAVAAGERRAAIDRVLDRLRPQYREVLVLRYLAHLDYADIATTMDLPIGTVKTWLFRAKASFRVHAQGEEAL
ncbi:MAG: sigma-70 family RNA polymerase sigma factor [Deltaproteobacteria bacterium]|nr:sigma-70 family RNA polymerase sigma factor [Deltaproteobacteria bacterium]